MTQTPKKDILALKDFNIESQWLSFKKAKYLMVKRGEDHFVSSSDQAESECSYPSPLPPPPPSPGNKIQ